MTEKVRDAAESEKILGACFFQTRNGSSVSGKEIVDAVLKDPRVIKNGHVRMSALASFVRTTFQLGEPRKPLFASPVSRDQSDAFLASGALYALETAGVLRRTPNGYDRTLHQWDVQPTEGRLSPRAQRRIGNRLAK